MQRLISFGLLAALVAYALPDRQQQRRASCDLQVTTDSTAMSRMTTLPGGEMRSDVWGGVEATCGSKWLRADSASFYDLRGILYLFGDVEYRDEGRTLVAERATYYQEEDWVRAEGQVVLIDTVAGSSLRGPLLDYYPSSEIRPVERMYAPGRPHLTFYPEEGAAAEAFEVDADRVHIYGDSAITGAGHVVAVRGDLTAYGDSMDLDLGRDALWLLGSPRVEAQETVLDGDSILVVLEESRVREIRAWPNASARSSELTLAAPHLHLFVESDEIERVVASAGDPDRTGAVDSAGRAPWARSLSGDYELIADSIDIERPGGQLDRVVAVRQARAATLEPLVLGGELVDGDWLEGDTVIGYFAPPDTAGGEEAQLERLKSIGSARALYYIWDQAEQGEGSSGPPGVNYVIGRQITLWLDEGEVRTAEVVGPAVGTYLEPLPLATDGDSAIAPPDSLIDAATDTTAVDSATARGGG